MRTIMVILFLTISTPVYAQCIATPQPTPPHLQNDKILKAFRLLDPIMCNLTSAVILAVTAGLENRFSDAGR